MKTSMKKLTVFGMIAALVLFVAAAMASASDDGWSNTIQGKFAVTGSNACLIAPGGFDSSLQPQQIPIPGVPLSFQSAQTWEGVYTFKHSGKGALDVIAHDVGGPTGGGGSLSIHWDFNYTVNHGGLITFTLVPKSYIGQWLTGLQAPNYEYLGIKDSWGGVISPDGNQIFVTWGAPLILYLLDTKTSEIPTVGVQVICNGSFVLFRLQ
jgi:hypothetical protein